MRKATNQDRTPVQDTPVNEMGASSWRQKRGRPDKLFLTAAYLPAGSVIVKVVP